MLAKAKKIREVPNFFQDSWSHRILRDESFEHS